LRPLLERVAHPETVDDIAALLIPNTGNLLAQAAPASAGTTARTVGAATGRGLAATGRVMENIATSTPVQRISELGAVGELLYKGDVTGAAIAGVAPRAAAMTGRGLQRAGAALERVATIAPDVVPAGVGKVLQKAPTVNAAVIDALNDLREAPAAAPRPRLPEYPQAAADTMRLLKDKPVVAATRPPAAAIAPVAAHAPVTPPAAAVRNLNDVAVTPAQAKAEAVLQFNPSKVLATVKETFTKLGETPLRAEASNAMELMRRGVPAEDAVAKIVSLRKSGSAVEDLAARLGGPKDAVVKARVASRNSSGRWTE
jgi:hypothetical protein